MNKSHFLFMHALTKQGQHETYFTSKNLPLTLLWES